MSDFPQEVFSFCQSGLDLAVGEGLGKEDVENQEWDPGQQEVARDIDDQGNEVVDIIRHG